MILVACSQETPVPKNAGASTVFAFVSGIGMGRFSEERGDRLIFISPENEGRRDPAPLLQNQREYFMINVDEARVTTRIPADMKYVSERGRRIACHGGLLSP